MQQSLRIFMNGKTTRQRWWSVGLLAIAGCTLFSPAAAQDGRSEGSSLLIRGFGTVALARSSNDDAGFLRDISQPEGVSDTWTARNDSIAGLQANYRANNVLEFVLQGISHYRHDRSFSPELTWAFVKYDPTPRLSLRLGRIGTEFLMQSDSRMVGYSYLPIRPPVESFGSLPVNYADGIDVQVRWPLGEGVLRTRLAVSRAREKLPTYDLDGSHVYEGSLGYDGGPWQVRYNYAQARFAQDIPALDALRSNLALAGAGAAARALGLAGTMSRYHAIGMVFDDGDWLVHGATNTVRLDSHVFQNSRASHVLVGYRFGSLTPFIGHSWVKSKSKRLDTGLAGPAFAALNSGVAATLAARHQDQRTFTLGTRWDFRHNMDLKAQLDLVRGEPSSAALFADVRPGWNGRTNVLSVALDFVF